MRTVDLVEAFVAKRPDVAVRTIKQRHYEVLDERNLDSMKRLDDETVDAQYCWRIDIGNSTHWISQQHDSELIDAQNIDDDDQGTIVGTFAKVSIDGEELHYGPTDLYAKVWARIQTIGAN